MNKYIINFGIGLVAVAVLLGIIALFMTYPMVATVIAVPVFVWACYQIGGMVKDIWEVYRADRSTRM